MSTLQQTAESRSQAFVRTYLLGRRAVIASLLCLVSFAAFWTAQRLTGVSMIDLMVYRAEGWTVRTGGDLYAMRATYADLPTTYPPFAALLFMPLTLLDVAEMRTLATAGNLVLLVAVVHLSLRLIGRPERVSRPAATLLIASVAVWCEPVWTTLRYGQVNLLLTALVLWDLSRRSGHRWAGVGIGIAAGIKLTPALFVVFLALCGVVQCLRRARNNGGVARWWNSAMRQAAVATGAFLGTVALGVIVLPYDSGRFWLDAVVFRSDRVGHTDITDNQALSGVAARLLHTGEPGLSWLVPAALVALLGLATAVAAASAGPRRLPYASAWAAVACAFTALLVSPVSWSHHWVWCVPAVLLLGAEALRRDRALRWRLLTGAGASVFCSYALWLVPHGITGPVRPELSQNAGEMALSALYPAFGLGFLALAATVSVRALRRPAPYEPDAGTGGSRTRSAESARLPKQSEAALQAVAKE